MSFGVVEALAVICVEQALNDNGPSASGGIVCPLLSRWSSVVSVRGGLPVAVSTDAFTAVSKRPTIQEKRVLLNVAEWLQAECTGDAFVICRKNPTELVAQPAPVPPDQFCGKMRSRGPVAPGRLA